MSRERGVGLFICSCHQKEEGPLQREMEVKEVAFVEVWKDLCSKEGQRSMREALQQESIGGLVLLCSYPRSIERGLFFSLLYHRGKSLALVERGFDERERITKAIQEISSLSPPLWREIEVEKRCLVIGGGIAGMVVALDMAEAGFLVYLVEESPSLGGRMAQLDKTFPTLDCSACILTPKMVDVAKHPNIELLTCAQVEEVKGHVGSFRVLIRKKARYVKEDLCSGCGLCATACRLKNRIPSEFQEGKGERGAIYLPFPQAVPLSYTIDPKSCLFLTKGKCGQEPACALACQRQAIDFQDKDSFLEISVGSIVVATGFSPFSGPKLLEYGYANNPQVVTGLELERLLSSSGPTGGELLIQTERGLITPKEVAFIQCVGSRDVSVDRPYCSRVCCMSAAKQALLLKEKIPNLSISIYYMDMRSFGRGYEEFYDKVRRKGVHYYRGSPGGAYKRGEKMVVRFEDTLSSQVLEREYDLVVLSVGMEPRKGARDLGQILGLSLSADGFYEEYHPKLCPMETERPGIYLAGACQGPKDIPDTVAQAKGAAAAAMIPLFSSKLQILEHRGKYYWKGAEASCKGGAYHG